MSLLKEGDGVNFQRASCTLDGCVKIYTNRVDSVATETGKLLSGLADSNTGKNKGADDDADGDDEDPDGEEGEKKKSKKRVCSSCKQLAKLTSLVATHCREHSGHVLLSAAIEEDGA